MKTIEEVEAALKMLKRLGVKSYKKAEMSGQWDYEVEFFSPGDEELEKKPRADEKVNEATGLTRSRSQDMFLMDE